MLPPIICRLLFLQLESWLLLLSFGGLPADWLRGMTADMALRQGSETAGKAGSRDGERRQRCSESSCLRLLGSSFSTGQRRLTWQC